MKKNKYSKFSNDEISNLLENIPNEKWNRHPELIKEGILRLFVKEI